MAWVLGSGTQRGGRIASAGAQGVLSERRRDAEACRQNARPARAAPPRCVGCRIVRPKLRSLNPRQVLSYGRKIVEVDLELLQAGQGEDLAGPHGVGGRPRPPARLRAPPAGAARSLARGGRAHAGRVDGGPHAGGKRVPTLWCGHLDAELARQVVAGHAEHGHEHRGRHRVGQRARQPGREARAGRGASRGGGAIVRPACAATPSGSRLPPPARAPPQLAGRTCCHRTWRP